MALPDKNSLSGDFDSLCETFSRFMPHAKISQAAGETNFQWAGRFANADGRSLWRAEFDHDLSVQVIEDAGYFSLIVPVMGLARVVIDGRERFAAPGQVILLSAPGVRDTSALCVNGFHKRTSLKWRTADCMRVLSSLFEDDYLSFPDLSPLVDFTGGSGNVFFRLLDTVAYDIAHPSDTKGLASALMNEALLRLLFDRVIFTHDHRGGRFERAPLPRHIRRAVDYMHANAERPIRVLDIAAECRISVRTLEAGFLACFGQSPLAYLRQIRLLAVRDELTRPRDCLPISAIARRWGFVDMGRFSARYRREFGELPSQTVRRV